MSECFWVDADAELVEALRVDLTDYATLKVRTVFSAALRDVAEWESYALNDELPLVVVQGRSVTVGPGAHGDGLMHGDKQYTWSIAGLVEGELTDATRDAKILYRRIERSLMARKTVTAIATDGERASFLSVTGGEVVTVRKRDSQADSWFGICLVAVRLMATV